MNDDKLKQLIQKDLSTPKAPVGEWSTIVSKIEAEKKSFFNFKFLVPIAAVLVIAVIGVNRTLEKQISPDLEAEVVESLMEDLGYFDSDTELYSWID